MFISVHDLELRKLEFAESIAPGFIDFGQDLVQRAPLKTSGRAELLEEHHGGKKGMKVGAIKGEEGGRAETSALAIEVGDRPCNQHGERGWASEAGKCRALQDVGREAVRDGIHG